MSATQHALSVQTTQLATALKKSNVRGRWGEIALERLVEMSGMTEHVDSRFRNRCARMKG